MKKSGLGRGLSALIPEGGVPGALHPLAEGLANDSLMTAEMETGEEMRFEEVPVADISPNPYQPRQGFDDEKMAELTASIREQGVLQPLLLRKGVDGYELVAGERRWRAARRAGLATVPAVVRSVEDRDSLEQAIVENLHRDDLNPLEEAAAFHRLMDDFGFTQHEVAVRVGRSRPAVANSLRLLQLPDVVQQLIMVGSLSAGHARALAGLRDRPLIERLATRVVDEGLSVRQTENLVRSLDEVIVPAVGSPGEITARPRDAALLEVEQVLADRLDTTVRVVTRGRKGRIVVEFADLDDLERLFRLLEG